MKFQQQFFSVKSNKNIDIKFSANDASLEYPSSGTLKVKVFESPIKSIMILVLFQSSGRFQ